MDAALGHLRSQRAEVKPEDVGRLSPLADKHFNVLGRYHFTVTDSILRATSGLFAIPAPRKNSCGQPKLNVRFGSNDSGTPMSATNQGLSH